MPPITCLNTTPRQIGQPSFVGIYRYALPEDIPHVAYLQAIGMLKTEMARDISAAFRAFVDVEVNPRIDIKVTLIGRNNWGELVRYVEVKVVSPIPEVEPLMKLFPTDEESDEEDEDSEDGEDSEHEQQREMAAAVVPDQEVPELERLPTAEEIEAYTREDARVYDDQFLLDSDEESDEYETDEDETDDEDYEDHEHVPEPILLIKSLEKLISELESMTPQKRRSLMFEIVGRVVVYLALFMYEAVTPFTI
ncbi:hypothetical protein EDC01DRAFT_777615 [Geopyxis carbonaria]|nr:hypothetical protein EDC01DRAFT_777615 [Geopyxis carbonaria]